MIAVKPTAVTAVAIVLVLATTQACAQATATVQTPPVPGPGRVVTPSLPPAASRDEARACMDSEDRIVALDRRNDADKAAIQAASNAAAHDDLLEAWRWREAEFHVALKAHTQLCQRVRITPEVRTAILKEREAAASAVR